MIRNEVEYQEASTSLGKRSSVRPRSLDALNVRLGTHVAIEPLPGSRRTDVMTAGSRFRGNAYSWRFSIYVLTI
jgi:hypothetical protein